MSKAQKIKKADKLFKELSFPILIFTVLIVIFITIAYNILNFFATDIVTSYLNELVSHDKENIKDYVADRFLIMNKIYEDLKIREPNNVEEMLTELNVQSKVHSVELFYLVDNDGNLYSSNYVITPAAENPFMGYIESGVDKNVGRYDMYSKYDAYSKEYMLYYLNFSDKPLEFKASDHKFTALIMLRDIYYLSEKMRIPSFDGRGYTSIVDENGTFVVSDESITALGQLHNCFELIEGRPIKGMTREEIIRRFQALESFTFWYTTENNVNKIVLFSPTDISGWTFLSSVEESVYTDQMRIFIEIILFIIGGLFIIFMIVLLLYRYSSQKLHAFYSSVAEGVRSRQYYDDKTVYEEVTALAIVDIDHLKWINDTHGHLAGDEAIHEMAVVLIKCVGNLGEVCRFGGDEFIIAFKKEVPVDEFTTLINNIVEKVRLIRLESFPDFSMTLSIGAYYGGGITSDVFVKADELLYEAKKERNRAIIKIPEEQNI